MKDDYKKTNVSASQLLLNEDVKPTCLSADPSSNLIVCSNNSKQFYSVTLRNDGVILHGDVGCVDGKAETAKFCQPNCVCVELNVYICDSQTDHIKVIATIMHV